MVKFLTELNLERRLAREIEFFIDNLLVRIHFTIVMIRWTGLAPWEFEFPFPGRHISTFLALARSHSSQTLEVTFRK